MLLYHEDHLYETRSWARWLNIRISTAKQAGESHKLCGAKKLLIRTFFIERVRQMKGLLAESTESEFTDSEWVRKAKPSE